MYFTTFQNEKTPFQAIKTRGLESRKIDTFPKGLTHGFSPKMALVPHFFFKARQARKMSFTRFQNEKTPFQAIKTRSLKSRKIDIFLKGLTDGFGLKLAAYPTFFFFSGNIGQENGVYDFLHQKNVFAAYENKKFKKSKN